MKRALLLCVLLCACEAGEHATGDPISPPDTAGVLDSALHLDRVKDDGNFPVGTAGEFLRLPLIVRVLNRDVPVQGMFVHWQTAYPGAYFDPEISKSDLNGHAVSSFHAGTRAGLQAAEASINGKTAVFYLDVRPDIPDQFLQTRGEGDSARSALAVFVRSLDQYGNGVPQVGVDWQPLSGGVSLAPGSVSGQSGEAGAVLVFGPAKGPATVSASIPGFDPVVFHVKSY